MTILQNYCDGAVVKKMEVEVGDVWLFGRLEDYRYEEWDSLTCEKLVNNGIMMDVDVNTDYTRIDLLSLKEVLAFVENGAEKCWCMVIRVILVNT